MVGFPKAHFIRTLPLPKELLCTVCEEVLNDPYNCTNCLAWFCKSCLINICAKSQSCEHKYVEANKFLKNKIDEMYIKCEFSAHGCIKTDKVCEIQKHEKACHFKKFSCHHPECMRETTKDELKKHNENCPFSIHKCQDGCGKQMKLFEMGTHRCLEWLHNVIENQNIKYRVLKEENDELRIINEEQKKYFLEKLKELEKKNASLVEDLKNEKIQQEKLILFHQKEKKLLISDYEQKINRMHEKTFQQISHYRQKSEEHFKNLSKNIERSVVSYLETTKDNAKNFNNHLQADSNNLVLSKSMDLNNTTRFSSPQNTKKILNQSMQNSNFSGKKGSSGKKKLGNSCLVKL